MSQPLRELFDAILEDKMAQAKALLKQDPTLARLGAPEAVLEKSIPHWIYVGDTALHVAAAAHRPGLAKLLLGAGADVCASQNHRHAHPLHYAADGCMSGVASWAERQVTTIRLLLKAGGDIRAQDKNGATPLHRAVRTRSAEAVKCLLEAGAETGALNLSGSTPFHLAAQNTGKSGSGADQAKVAQREIIQAFLNHGVSPKLKDAQGRSVIEWAKSDWVREMLASR
jgi:ankyrin repeat protein